MRDLENNLAVLIDFENIAAGTEKEGLGRFDVETLMQRIKDKGRILVARSYGDWGRFSRFKQSLLTSNVTMMELTSHGMQDKNRADIAMVVDALELAFTRAYVDTFVVVSGDSDFTPLVLKMRELNKRVIGIGTRKSTSRLLIQACDEFMFYDTIVQPKNKRTTRKVGGSQSREVQEAFEHLEEALEGLQRENPDPPHGSVVKTAILRKTPDFNESDLGFSSFARFLETAQEAGIVKIIRDTKSGGYRVDSLDEEEPEVVTEEPTVEPPAGVWFDEYLPEGCERYNTVLATAGYPMVSAATRLAILEALEQVVVERDQKRRKTTLQFVREDMKKKLRRTHAELPNELMRGVLDGLLTAGELIHRDGTAIRSTTAAFTLQKDATALNEALVRLYLSHLREANVDVSDTAKLAELFYGDADRRRSVEEAVAWLSSEGEREENLDLDLDDLLSVGTSAAPPAPVREEPKAARVKPAPREREREREPAPRERERERERETESLPMDLDALLEVEPAAAAPAAPESESDDEPKKRRRTRKKSDETEEAPRKASTGGRKRKSEVPAAEERPSAPAGSDLDLDLDALLEPQPRKS